MESDRLQFVRQQNDNKKSDSPYFVDNLNNVAK